MSKAVWDAISKWLIDNFEVTYSRWHKSMYVIHIKPRIIIQIHRYNIDVMQTPPGTDKILERSIRLQPSDPKLYDKIKQFIYAD